MSDSEKNIIDNSFAEEIAKSYIIDSLGVNLENDLALLLDNCKVYLKEPNLELIEKAYNFMLESHFDKKRASGEPYYTHPLQVAIILMTKLKIDDMDSVIAALLHDTVEDVGNVTLRKQQMQNVRELFGDSIAHMVDGLTNIRGRLTKELDEAETYRKLFLSLVRDARVILVKLADRLHNMLTLQHLNNRRQTNIANETLNFYTPLAHRLGMRNIMRDMEDLALRYADPEKFITIKKAMDKKRIEFIQYILNIEEFIKNKLDEFNIPNRISAEHAHYFEIYRKMMDGTGINDIDKFFSIVIVLDTDNIHQCHYVYGMISQLFKTIVWPKDLITNPSLIYANQGLESTHLGPDGQRFDVIIRTKEMDSIASNGISGELNNRSGIVRALDIPEEELEDWGEWMSDMISNDSERALKIIWEAIRINLYVHYVSVFDKEGKEYHLPSGSTLIDYAFAVSPETGMKCAGAKIGGRVLPLSTTLSHGDIIQLIISPNSEPDKEWQKFVVTHRAIVQLHKYFKDDDSAPIKSRQPALKVNYEAKLRITGEDRTGMLNSITQTALSIDNTNITRINLDTSGSSFEGLLTVIIKNNAHFNKLFSELLKIPGVKRVEHIE